jgi:hypothetical protein
MRSPALLLSAAALIAAASGSIAAEDLRSGPAVGQELPGSFQVLAVTGPFAGHFHSPVCEFGLDPAILVFFREVPEAGKPLAKLLKGLDGLVGARSDASLRAAGLLLNDGGYKDALERKVDDKLKVTALPLTKAIIAKDELAAQLGSLAQEAKTEHLELGLERAEGPKGYQINKDADVTVLAYQGLKVTLNRAFGKDQLTAEEADKVVKAIEATLPKAPRRPARRR